MSPLLSFPDCRILVVDDDEANVEFLIALLEDDGYRHIATTRDPRTVVALYQSFEPDLVLLDLHMPHLSGFAVMDLLSALKSDDDFLPVLILTADVNPDARLRALGQGAIDFLTKPLDAMEVSHRIRNLLAARVLHQQQRDGRKRAEEHEQRAEFLSDASRALGASLDVQTTLAVLPRLAVPRLADYSLIELNDDADGRLRIAAAHVDAAGAALLDAGTALWGGALPHRHPSVAAVATGESVLLRSIQAGELATDMATDAEQEALRLLDPRSLIIVPLIVAGRVAGALTLAMSASRRRYGDDDLALAEELMRRVAGAQANARLYDEAQRAARARDRILAVVAHDLRNPLNTIVMAADLLLEDTASPGRKQLEMMRRASVHMNDMIEDLLEVSRIDGAGPPLDLQPETVAALVAEAVSMLGPLAAARGIALDADVAADLPPIMADARRLLQVISNLVGNAVKFTERGGRIRVGCTAAADEVRFTVADTGRGIAPDELPHVFSTFWQASPDDRRGIGLGLSIAQGIVESHGGRIWVESERGRGSTFHFTIPAASRTAQPMAVHSFAQTV